MSPRDRELIFMSFSFDGAHERWLTALAHGGSVAVRGDDPWTPEETLEALHRHGVTVAAFPPAYLQQLAAAGGGGRQGRRRCGSTASAAMPCRGPASSSCSGPCGRKRSSTATARPRPW